MITVRTKNGSIVKVTEFAAKEMVKKMGAVIIDGTTNEIPVPMELQPVPMKLSPQQIVNDNELLLKENAELKAKNAKLANDIIDLIKKVQQLEALNEVEQSKDKQNDNVPVDKKAKKGSKTVDPNG
jgi:hypothetical protein